MVDATQTVITFDLNLCHLRAGSAEAAEIVGFSAIANVRLRMCVRD